MDNPRQVQSESDKLVITITQADNGFIVRIFPRRLVFKTQAELFAALEAHFSKPTNKGENNP